MLAAQTVNRCSGLDLSRRADRDRPSDIKLGGLADLRTPALSKDRGVRRKSPGTRRKAHNQPCLVSLPGYINLRVGLVPVLIHSKGE